MVTIALFMSYLPDRSVCISRSSISFWMLFVFAIMSVTNELSSRFPSSDSTDNNSDISIRFSISVVILLYFSILFFSVFIFCNTILEFLVSFQNPSCNVCFSNSENCCFNFAMSKRFTDFFYFLLQAI